MRGTPPKPFKSDNADDVAINNALTTFVFELPRLLASLQARLPNGLLEDLLHEFNRQNRPPQRPVVTPNAVVLMLNRSRASKNKEQLSRAELVYLIIFLGIIKLMTSKHENHFIFNRHNLSALTPENLMLCLTLTLHVAPLILNAINEATMVPKFAPANFFGIFSTLNKFLPLIYTFSPQALIPSRVDRGIKPKEENPTSEKAMVLYKPQQATGISADPTLEENPTSERAMVLYRPQQATGISADLTMDEIIAAIMDIVSFEITTIGIMGSHTFFPSSPPQTSTTHRPF